CGRYCYDPLGRRIGKQLMQRNQPKHISWFGWDGDKLVLTERDGTRIHTVYLHHSFVPLLRFEGDKPPTITPLADKLEQEVGITLPPDFKQTLHHIEQALRANRLSTEQHTWLNQIQLSPEYLATLVDPLPDTPYAAQLYDCNHLGTPQQLINLNGDIDWSITLDAWGNTLSEENPHQLHQPIRMQGQQYDEESGLHYNRHRYYDPTIGRYITQDPIGLDGGWNFYGYPTNPLSGVDPLGLSNQINLGSGFESYGKSIDSLDVLMTKNNSSPNEISQANHNMCIATNGWNPGNQYTKGIVFGSSAIGLGALGVGAALEQGVAVGIAKMSLSCAKNAGKSAIDKKLQNKKTSPAELFTECIKGAVDSGLNEIGSYAFDTSIDNLPN
ncbi:RHS repeat-associated core domain-containing protein, partial [Hafnia alvei]|uniref:RHS repeat-associated core domain-containing protein n=1 Tax=Hafnia alvei TaxID=569 RepID=UPI0016AD7EF0